MRFNGWRNYAQHILRSWHLALTAGSGHSTQSAGPGDIANVALVREHLIVAAKAGTALSYSEMLGKLGFRFTRPKMRALCKTLDAIDRHAVAAGEPELAVLVVRESDRLPGQGWWVGMAEKLGHKGDWTGPDAMALVTRLQDKAFAYWQRG